MDINSYFKVKKEIVTQIVARTLLSSKAAVQGVLQKDAHIALLQLRLKGK